MNRCLFTDIFTTSRWRSIACALLSLSLAVPAWALDSGEPAAREATLPSQTQRPAVWWRALPQSGDRNGFWVPAEYEYAPQTSPQVYVWVSASGKYDEQRGTLIEFFTGRRLPFKTAQSIDDEQRSKETYADGYTFPTRVRLALRNGQQLDLVSVTSGHHRYANGGSGEIFDDDDEVMGDYAPKAHPPFHFVMNKISAIGTVLEAFKNPDGSFRGVGFSKDPIKIWVDPSAQRSNDPTQGDQCDPLSWAIQARDQGGKIVWRRMFAAHGPLLKKSLGPAGFRNSPYDDVCFGPNQHEMRPAERVSLEFDDGTALIDLGFGVLRIRVQEGRPDIIPPNVSIVDYANLMRLKQLLFEFSPDNIYATSVWEKMPTLERNRASNRERYLSAKATAASYLLLQYYMFPALIPNNTTH